MQKTAYWKQENIKFNFMLTMVTLTNLLSGIIVYKLLTQENQKNRVALSKENKIIIQSENGDENKVDPENSDEKSLNLKNKKSV